MLQLTVKRKFLVSTVTSSGLPSFFPLGQIVTPEKRAAATSLKLLIMSIEDIAF